LGGEGISLTTRGRNFQELKGPCGGKRLHKKGKLTYRKTWETESPEHELTKSRSGGDRVHGHRETGHYKTKRGVLEYIKRMGLNKEDP